MDDDTLDDSWINAFKKLESDYDDFYKEAPTAAEMCFIYVNASNNVESVRKENFLLKSTPLSVVQLAQQRCLSHAMRLMNLRRGER